MRALREFGHEGQSEWSAIDLRSCVESALNLLAGQLGAGVQVLRHYADLPLVVCRPGQINQVFHSLISNALQAMEGDSGCLTIASGSESPEAVWVEVADTGGGICPEHLPRIFEPFFTTRAVGQGTVFRVTLPARAAEKT